MPKRPAAPTPPEVIEATTNKSLAELVALAQPPVEPLTDASGESPHRTEARRQLADLAELIANARAVRDTGFLADAQKRIAALRLTLGL